MSRARHFALGHPNVLGCAVLKSAPSKRAEPEHATNLGIAAETCDGD